jgi:ParB family chromosome partitioning protein
MITVFGQLTVLALTKIRENPVALRNVNRQSEEYLGLVSSIREKGFLGAITVRPQKDRETGEEYFELVDGLHRFNASKDAGLTEINVDIVSLNDAQVLEAQIMANIHKVETKPKEYSQQLRRILAMNPLMTEVELAKKLGKSEGWIKDRLGLNKIENPVIGELINEGKIPLSNAYALAKLPIEEQNDWVERAMTLTPEEFVPQVNKRAKEIAEAKRKGGDAAPAEFQPVAYLQKMRDIKDAADSGEVATMLIGKTGITTPKEAFQLALLWTLHLDPLSVEAQKAKDEQRKQEAAELKKQREAEKARKRSEEAQKKAAEAAEVK